MVKINRETNVSLNMLNDYKEVGLYVTIVFIVFFSFSIILSFLQMYGGLI